MGSEKTYNESEQVRAFFLKILSAKFPINKNFYIVFSIIGQSGLNEPIFFPIFCSIRIYVNFTSFNIFKSKIVPTSPSKKPRMLHQSSYNKTTQITFLQRRRLSAEFSGLDGKNGLSFQ